MTIHYTTPAPAELDAAALVDLARWRATNGEQYSPLDYLYGNATLELAAAFTALFWPDSFEHEGGVFLREKFTARRHAEWLDAYKGDLHDVQVTMNQVVLHAVIPGAEDVSAANLAYLQGALAEMWDARLARRHPARAFDVYCYEVDLGPAVSFAARPGGGAAVSSA